MTSSSHLVTHYTGAFRWHINTESEGRWSWQHCCSGCFEKVACSQLTASVTVVKVLIQPFVRASKSQTLILASSPALKRRFLWVTSARTESSCPLKQGYLQHAFWCRWKMYTNVAKPERANALKLKWHCPRLKTNLWRHWRRRRHRSAWTSSSSYTKGDYAIVDTSCVALRSPSGKAKSFVSSCDWRASNFEVKFRRILNKKISLCSSPNGHF